MNTCSKLDNIIKKAAPQMADLLKNLNAAVSAYNAGKLAEAEQICQEIVIAQQDFFDALHLLALVQLLLGKRETALASFDRALAVRPDHAEALSNRGVTLRELKRFDEALASFHRALVVRPDHAEALSNRGLTLHELKRLEEALASFDRALKVRPDYSVALFNRGLTLHELKRFEEALASFDGALRLQPNYAEVLCNRGLTLHELKRLEEALASFDRALKVRPDYAEAFSNRGITLHELKRFEEALASYDCALKVRPHYPEVLSNRGLTLHALMRYEEALASFDQALTFQPDHAEALSNRGMTLRELNRFEDALESYDHALIVRPDFAKALSNRGNALHELNRFEEALASFDRALEVDPEYAEAHSNRGVTLHALMRFEGALASFERALKLRPDYADAHYNEALCRILIGDFNHGWEKCEWRWETQHASDKKRNFTQPLWLGSDEIAGKTILLHGEQGFGDMIQFCRYVPLVAERAAQVILEISEPLRELMRSLSGGAQIISKGDPLPCFDIHCPLLSLPLAFRTGLKTIPSTIPYLHASPQAVLRWDARLGPPKRPRIGLAWSGRPTHKNDRNRSIKLSALLPLLDVDAVFVSLQHDVRADDAATLKDHVRIIHFGDELKNFSDAAALISNLDLVISVDTSVAHLAGALSKPVWVLLPFIPDWRWLLDRNDSPWYPTARLFRQDHTRVWDDVIARVHSALCDYAPPQNGFSQVTSLFTGALKLHQAGQLKEAENAYNQILAMQPDHFDSLHLRAVIFHQRGDHTEAVRQIDLALKSNPNNIFALNNRGIALKELKRFEEALASYDRALTVRPDYAEALLNRGAILHELRRFDEALASYDRALTVRPDYADASYNRGNTLRELRQFEDALASYDRALMIRPDYAEAFMNCGITLHELKRFEDALVSYERALALRPNYAEARSNCGVTLHELQRFEDALASYDRALALRPDYAEALYNRGITLHDLQRFEEALACYDQALSVRPGYAEALYNRGNTLSELKRFDEAFVSYDRALAVRPDYADVHFSEALFGMLIGDFRRGWQKYEWRWKTAQARNDKRDFSQPLWDGSVEITGKTILLHAEQGFGDTIQFCRYVPHVAKRGARVLLEVQRPLYALMSTLSGTVEIVSKGDPLPSFDLHCPLLSLPLAFGTQLETIPSETPYLHALPHAVMNWKERLGAKTRPTIGLAWSGRSTHKNDRNRSIGLNALRPLLALNASYVSLQREVRASDATVLRERSDLLDCSDELKDFSETGALISNLDLIISVDTSVAHLAGAMAKPVWILLPFIPDWRWLLDRGDSPWYPTARLFRQDDTRSWDKVIARVRAALQDYVLSV